MKEWLVVDGYNVINSWQDFRKFREENLEHARELLKEKLAEYTAFKGYSGIVVFDAQEVQGVASFEKNGALEIVFTNEGETADSWIERRVYDLVKSGSSVFVVTSDYAEQLNVLGSGAYRISAREFREEYLLTKNRSRSAANDLLGVWDVMNLAAGYRSIFWIILKSCGAIPKN